MHGLRFLLPFVILLMAGQYPSTAAAEASSSSLLDSQEVIMGPPAFYAACARFDWLCANDMGAEEALKDAQLQALAVHVNDTVNSTVRQVSDRSNYGAVNAWTLPRSGRGDCEDIVLQKMKQLLDSGVAPRRLLMAIVLYSSRENHAVLVVRIDSGDLVLDSLRKKVVSPDCSGYRFLAIQSAADRTMWQVLLRRPSDDKLAATPSTITAGASGQSIEPAER